jgi:hypothetical protein
MKAALMRKARWLVPLLGLAATGAAADASVAPVDAPAQWTHYAQQMTASISQWLESEDIGASELRTKFSAEGSHDDPAQPLVLRIWVKGDHVSDVRVGSPDASQSEDDLRAFLIGRKLGSHAPKGMIQPVNIAINFTADTSGTH